MNNNRRRITVAILASADEWEKEEHELMRYERDTYNSTSLSEIMKDILPALANIYPTPSGVMVMVKIVAVEVKQ